MNGGYLGSFSDSTQGYGQATTGTVNSFGGTAFGGQMGGPSAVASTGAPVAGASLPNTTFAGDTAFTNALAGAAAPAAPAAAPAAPAAAPAAPAAALDSYSSAAAAAAPAAMAAAQWAADTTDEAVADRMADARAINDPLTGADLTSAASSMFGSADSGPASAVGGGDGDSGSGAGAGSGAGSGGGGFGGGEGDGGTGGGNGGGGGGMARGGAVEHALRVALAHHMARGGFLPGLGGIDPIARAMRPGGRPGFVDGGAAGGEQDTGAPAGGGADYSALQQQIADLTRQIQSSNTPAQTSTAAPAASDPNGRYTTGALKIWMPALTGNSQVRQPTASYPQPSSDPSLRIWSALAAAGARPPSAQMWGGGYRSPTDGMGAAPSSPGPVGGPSPAFHPIGMPGSGTPPIDYPFLHGPPQAPNPLVSDPAPHGPDPSQPAQSFSNLFGGGRWPMT